MAGKCAIVGGSASAPLIVGGGVFVLGLLTRSLTTAIIAGGAAGLIAYFACK
jgi:uncharacterized membrane protein